MGRGKGLCAAYDSSACVFYEQGGFQTVSHWEYPTTVLLPHEIVGREVQREAELSLVTRDTSFTMWKADRERQMALNAGFT